MTLTHKSKRQVVERLMAEIPANQLRLVVYHIIYRVLYIFGG